MGQRTLLDVLNAEQELLNSEVNLVTDQRNVPVASYAVLSVIGRLNAQELGAANLVYDPEAHYHDVRRKWFDISITHGDGRREVMEAAPPPEPLPPIGRKPRVARFLAGCGAAAAPIPNAVDGRHGACWCSAPASAIEWRGLGLRERRWQRTRSRGPGT